MNPDSTPPRVQRDALDRAARTLLQGLGLTVAGAAVTALSAGFADGIRWTDEYWVSLGLATLGASLMAGASYLHRRLSPPAGDR